MTLGQQCIQLHLAAVDAAYRYNTPLLKSAATRAPVIIKTWWGVSHLSYISLSISVADI